LDDNLVNIFQKEVSEKTLKKSLKPDVQTRGCDLHDQIKRTWESKKYRMKAKSAAQNFRIRSTLSYRRKGVQLVIDEFICLGRFVKIDKFRIHQIYLCVVKKLFDFFGDFEKSRTSNACNFLCAHWKI
jgi:hypothetical protein